MWKISPLLRFDPRTIQPLGSRYTDWATRPTNTVVLQDKCGLPVCTSIGSTCYLLICQCVATRVWGKNTIWNCAWWIMGTWRRIGPSRLRRVGSARVWCWIRYLTISTFLLGIQSSMLKFEGVVCSKSYWCTQQALICVTANLQISYNNIILYGLNQLTYIHASSIYLFHLKMDVTEESKHHRLQ